jgi:PAS domain S-box-containing protein
MTDPSPPARAGLEDTLRPAGADGGAVTAEPVDDEIPPGSRFGNFLIVRTLGRGAMGVVYEAENVVLGRKAAVKVQAEGRAGAGSDADARFLREARTLARLDHPNVVRVYEAGVEGGIRYLAMELVRGGSAQDRLSARPDGRGLPAGDAAAICADACRGLAAAHAAGVIHRDVKPANILIAPDGSAKIADFGLVRVTDPGEPAEGLVMVGTIDFMSPEQCSGWEVGPRSDVYSLGATLYMLLTGRTPYDGPGPQEIALDHRMAPAPDPRAVDPSVPDDLAAVVLRAMAKPACDRYLDAAAMLGALEAARDRLTGRPDPLEAARLAVLRGYGVLDSPPDPALDELVRLAARVCGKPISVISLVDASRQWFKARVGVDVPETPRELSFCSHAIAAGPGMCEIPDARLDARVASNPVVTAADGIRFYAGCPLVTPSGAMLGTLCVADRRPGRLTPEQAETLAVLSRQVVAHLELRRRLQLAEASAADAARSAEALRRAEAQFRALLDDTPRGVFGVDADGRCTFINRAASEALGYAPTEVVGRDMHALIQHHRADGAEFPAEESPVRRSVRVGEAVRVEGGVFFRRDGRSVRVSYAARPTREAGRVTGAVVHFAIPSVGGSSAASAPVST